MPKRARSQLSKYTSQARAAKIRRMGESSSERSQRLAEQNQRNSQVRARESSVERSQRLALQNLRTSELRARESRPERSQRLHEQNDFKSYSDAESMISDNEEVTIEATSSGGRPYITIDGSTVSTGRKRPRPTAAGLSKKYKATSTQDDVDVMKLMVVDDITEPSKPVKRRVDVLLKMCRTMFREKDHEISILREQVEELTKKNVRLRNALIDMKKTATIEDTEIPEETPTSGKKSKDVKKAKVKQCKHKGDEVKVATVGTIPEPTRVKKEPVDVKIDNNIEIPRIGDEINTRSNVIEEIGQEMDPLIIKTEPVYDNERPVAVTELNYCDTEDVVAFMAGPISIEETAPDIVGLETHDVVIGDGDSESLWSTIKQEVD
ncbi:uncharacterized protein LOC113510111 isoform X8 [Galleria mellonella]|uniref:Uncharacterized protein LOC113510111 isoform X8 n=1 Tax=Galleria mellonella TaxID=7137 RepID=A0A6J3C184_GALME|nr:uncharacterized protein LOC113510111 isoform X8 [Galleria mellonella]XP_052754940.1 uncharacterized protein LOC113510111 isoform X8 [Galleria mellonella]XP_052754946.1 uncharacterized protein LOC113510111 isoform X8 [Galleria mellonella]